MKLNWALAALAALAAAGVVIQTVAQADTGEQLERHRNLGKAFYENPTTQQQAVDELKKALELAPDSTRERLNYGLALLRNGQADAGIAEIEKVQARDPSLPHTWFNLGIEYKRLGDFERAQEQLEKMVELVPDSAVSHYNLGTLYKLSDRTADAIREFGQAVELDPTLAAPHFQLFNMYRQAGRREDSAAQLEIFETIKERQADAAVPEDMEWSFYSELLDVMEPVRDSSPAPEVRFDSQTLAGSVDASTAGIEVIDADADGQPDLLVWSSAGLTLYRNGHEPVGDQALGKFEEVTAAAPGDLDNDGRADLAVATIEGITILRNTEDGFVPLQASLPSGRFEKLVWLDFDHDRDQDLFLLGARSVLLRNQGSAGFVDHTGDFPFATGHALDAAVFRVTPDSMAFDLAVSFKDRAGVLYRDRLGGRYEATSLPQLPDGATNLLAADVDHDAWIDLTFSSGGASRVVSFRDGEPRVSRSETEQTVFADLANSGRLSAPAPAALDGAKVWAAADFNNDARIDLAAVDDDGQVRLLINQTDGSHHWLRVTLRGTKAPKLAPGAEVEVRAGARYQKHIYRGYPMLIGLGEDTQIDTVRIMWPDGLIQNETNQPVDRTETYQEAERLSGSCPTIWTWDGQGFRFITDVLGVAPLGASSSDGTYFPTDHDEYIFIPADALVPSDGHYAIRVTEELAEVTYLDQVKLIAVDHPADLDLLTNEKFVGPPFPEFKLFGARERSYPVVALADEQRDVLPRLLAKDRSYPDEFERSRLGVAAIHTLDLDFGDAAPENDAVLVLSGWVDWADGSTFLARSQEADGGLVMPYLQVMNDAGHWQTVLDDMGIPAGKPKTIVVDLNRKFVGPSRKIRIVTNLCVFWDEIYLAVNAVRPPVAQADVPAVVADLRFRGFSPVRIDPERKQPEIFLYANARATSMWNPTPGLYTRYGPVNELLRTVDDRFVIMGSGDEVVLRFDAASLGPPRRGWKRDFLLLVDGWAKDSDANTAHSQSVEPLPFHGMSAYPYPETERYPDDAFHRQYREEWNTRPALRPLQPLARAQRTMRP